MAEAIAFMMIFFALIAVFVCISRWVFRINDIINRLDRVVSLLGGNQAENPKSFMDGLKKGMND